MKMGTLLLAAAQIGAASVLATAPPPPRSSWHGGASLGAQVARTAAKGAGVALVDRAEYAGASVVRRDGYTHEKIMIVGDSMSAEPGYGPELSRRLTAAGIEHTIVNVAVPGHRAQDWVTPSTGARAPGAGPGRPVADKLTEALRLHRPTTVLLELGTNEQLDAHRPDLAAETDRMRTLYATLAQRVNAAGARLVMAIGIQISQPVSIGLQDREDRLNRRVLDQLWERYGPQGTYAVGLIDARVDWRPLGQTGIGPDGVHPDAAGWELRGRAWAAAGWNA